MMGIHSTYKVNCLGWHASAMGKHFPSPLPTPQQKHLPLLDFGGPPASSTSRFGGPPASISTKLLAVSKPNCLVAGGKKKRSVSTFALLQGFFWRGFLL